MKNQDKTQPLFDVLIIGAGLPAALLAQRWGESSSHKKIALLDHSPPVNSSPTPGDEESFSSPENFTVMGEKLYSFVKNSASPSSAETKPTDHFRSLASEILAFNKGKSTSIPLGDLETEKGVGKLLGGTSYGKAWGQVSPLLKKSEEIKSSFFPVLQKKLKITRKHPLTQMLANLGDFLQIPEILDSPPQVIAERLADATGTKYIGPTRELVQSLLKDFVEKDQKEFIENTHIISATYEKPRWILETSRGNFYTKTLVVTDNPWGALNWIDHKELPKEVINLAMKTKPVSAVWLREPWEEEPPTHPSLFITSEGVHGFFRDRTLFLKKPLDYELSLSAPCVVKAIKSLKRARKKLGPLPTTSSPKVREHISLDPFSGCQPLSFLEQRYSQKLDPEAINSPTLLFCGPAYGPSSLGDQNIIQSTLAASQALM